MSPATAIPDSNVLHVLTQDQVAPEEAMALAVIYKLVYRKVLTKTQLFGYGNTVDALMTDIADAIRDSAVEVGFTITAK